MPTGSLLKKILHSIPLGRKAAPDLRRAVADDDIEAFQAAYLSALDKPLKRLRKLLREAPLLAAWSENTVDLNGRERQLAASLDDLSCRQTGKKGKKKSKRSGASSRYDEVITSWLVEVGTAPGPWEKIAVAEILLREGKGLSPENFTQAISVLADASLKDSSGGLFDLPVGNEEDSAINQMIQQGESPWICSLLLSPLGGVQTLQKSASESLRKVLLDCSDSDGVVHGSLLNRLAEWLAPLTRSLIWSAAFEEPLLRGESVERMELVTERAALFVLPAQHHLAEDAPESTGPALLNVLEFLIPLGGKSHQKRLAKFLKACRKPAGKVPQPRKYKPKPASAVKIADSQDAAELAARSGLKPEKGGRAKKEKQNETRKLVQKKTKPEVSWQSDSSCVAILRSSADSDADVLTLEWHTGNLQLTFAAAGVPILTGNWNWSVQVDDEILQTPVAWKCSCWFLDPETVFMELEAEDATVVKQVRHVLLAPYDRFAMLTDSVTSINPDHKVQLVTSVPLVQGATRITDNVTRELTLCAGPRTVRSFPLWLDDDRVVHTLGSYREHDGQLEMAGIGKGGVTMPLALDWHPKRTSAPADWTRLTVTELRRTVGAHEASGFRIRIGNHQVQVYRSLVAPKMSRAVLGLHTWDESVYGRVPSKGGLLKPLVEVEYPE